MSSAPRHSALRPANLLLAVVAGLFLASPSPAADAPPTPKMDCTAWLAYWDVVGPDGGLAAVKASGRDLRGIQLFAATFDAEDKPVLREPLSAVPRDWDKTPGRPGLWLTVVNDSPAAPKDPDLIRRLLAPGRREAHVAELVALATEPYRFAGIELDYERIPPDLWSDYLSFAGELMGALASNADKVKDKALPVRVVLEPKAVYFKVPLPVVPEYALMAYNLHGGHSGPGPKADPAFIDKLAALCKDMDPKPRLALATGGFDWGPPGASRKVVAVTERKAMELEKREGVVSARDPVSRAKFFRYPLGAPRAQLHEVWYADGETLAFWAAHARKAGFDRFALWRLGGNDPVSLKTFLESEGLR